MTFTSTAESRFEQARFIPPDAIFALTDQYLKDTFPGKVNLGQGTYRDADGKPWVLSSVKKARESLLEQDLNHEYLPILGTSTFRQAAVRLVLGPDLFAISDGKVRNQ
jgi:aspartate aminotransferase